MNRTFALTYGPDQTKKARIVTSWYNFEKSSYRKERLYLYKKWIALGFIGILLIGGGFVVKGMQYDTPALKDSFTRNFIIQEEQAPEGFHVFESKIGTYKMLFPSDFQLDNEPDAYGRQGDFFELWNGYVDLEGKDSLGLKGTYQEVEDGQVETRLEILKTDRDKEQDFEIYEHDNLIIFLENQ